MKSLLVAALVTVSLGVAACGSKEPKGQVIATVGKAEITAIDLKNEMGGFSTPDPKVRRAAEQQALDQIIVRKVLSQAATKQKLDKTPEYVQQRDRGEEALLVQTWQQRLARAVPAPSKEEIDKFIAANPDIYAQRKVLTVDQIRMPRNVDAGVMTAMKPLRTVDEVAQLLSSRNIPFQRGAARFDAFTNDPQLVNQILKVAPNDVFVIPNGNLLLVSQSRSAEVVPVTVQQANAHASQYLKALSTRQAVQRDFRNAIEAARKDVKYAKAYDPKLQAKAAPPAKAK